MTARSLTKSVIRSNDAPAWGSPVAPATVWGGLIFASGELGGEPETLRPVSADVAEQTRQAFRNIDATLRAGGSSLQHVLKMNVYLNEPKDFDSFNRVFIEEFPELPPARTTVGVTLIDGYAVEIDVVAYVPD